MLAEIMKLCAGGAPELRKFCNSFVKILRGFRVISTPDAHFFGSEQTCDFTECFRYVKRFAQRTLAECTDFFPASGMPKFRKFCNSSADFLRRFCVISTPDAHFFRSEQPSDFTENCRNVARVVQRTLAECTHFLLRAACRNSGSFAILSRNFCAN